MSRQLMEKPDLALGGVTHQWLLSTLRSVDRLCEKGLSKNRNCRADRRCGKRLRLFPSRLRQAIQKRLPRCRLVILENARHEILVEADEVRNLFWKVFDEFILN